MQSKQIVNVIKRDSSIVPYDESKIICYLHVVSDDLIGINVDSVINQARLNFHNNIKTSDILSVLIVVTTQLISPSIPDYQFMSARLLINSIRREVWNSWLPQHTLIHRVKSRVSKFIYDPSILESYTNEEFHFIETKILDYSRDMLLTYSGARQFYDKYLIKDRISEQLHETPQEANILICMYMFQKYNSTPNYDSPFNGLSPRMYFIKLMYDKLSTFVISLPTPIYGGIRSTVKSYSSCCVIDCGDTAKSILSTNYILGDCITKRYGIGVNVGKVRAIGASINHGSVVHTGLVPFLKIFEATTKGFVQNGIRGGGGTISFPFWHLEVFTLLELKNNKGVQENRVRSLDYSIGLNKYFLTKALKNENVFLFSPEEVPLLSNDYRHDEQTFKRIYESYALRNDIRKKEVSALELIKKIATQRFETGRIYIYFMDSINYYGSFTESIFSSNLCQEIALPTRPVELLTVNGHENVSDDGLVSVCILSCVNVGRLKDNINFSDMEETCDIIVRFLNEMIDYQDYSFECLRKSAQDYRPLGIGISDVFHLLALKGLKYDSVECRNYMHRLTEKFQYCLLKSSCNLAREKGHPCKMFEKSKYSLNIFPMDRYKANVDKLITDNKLYCDWDSLREDVKKYGLYNTCLSAIPPAASSSSISNSTPGIDPPREIKTVKMSKHGMFAQIVPDYDVYKEFYVTSPMVRNEDYFKLIGVIQKWIDQGISTNSYYMDPDEKSIGEIINEIMNAYKWGLKSIYYLNSNKRTDKDVRKAFSTEGICGKDEDENGNKEEINQEDENGCAGGACSV